MDDEANCRPPRSGKLLSQRLLSSRPGVSERIAQRPPLLSEITLRRADALNAPTYGPEHNTNLLVPLQHAPVVVVTNVENVGRFCPDWSRDGR